MMSKHLYFIPLLCLISYFVYTVHASNPEGGTVYYVSQTMGNDSNTGLSTETPFASLAHVNGLDLQAGDSVLFRCGDQWRAESLVVTRSGTSGSPITFGSYPADCSNKPIFSGAQPISGWNLHNGNIYVADLTAGANAGLFPAGVNQLFMGKARLPFGRWPNLNSGDGGYATIDSQFAMDLTDAELPNVNWAGARVHIKGMRWYILNRMVTASSGTNFTVNQTPDCWGSNCEGWGYFLSNHLATLDQQGEWFYDENTQRVYLYASSGTPTDIEGSVVVDGADVGFHGGIILGRHLQDEINHVVIENIEVSRWFDNGVTTPRNLETIDNSYLTLRNLTIRDVDKAGVFLATWVWNAGPNSGWRGGRNITVEENLIERANQTAVNSYTTHSTFRRNTIRDIALIQNLGRDGMGCSITDGGGFCTRDGMAMRFPVDNPSFSGFGNTLEYNRLERTGSSGIQLFGANNLIQYNTIQQSGYAKGDNGSISIYGGSGFANTNAHDNQIRHNIVISSTGNTDGVIEAYQPLFGVGIYVDQYSDNITVADNTVVGSTIDGILFQNSRGTITGNTLYHNNAGTMSRGQIGLYGQPTSIGTMSDNVLYGLNVLDNFTFAKTLHTENADAGNIGTAVNNYYFQPYRADNISIGFNLQTLSQWQNNSGLDANSTAGWFNLTVGEPPRSRLFYNDTETTKVIDLGNRVYLDLDQTLVMGTLTLAPFTSQILIDTGEVPLSPTTLYFTDSGSPAQPVTLKNITGAPLTLNSISTTEHFSQINDCPVTLAIDETCTINVSFNPIAGGVQEGTLSVNHNAGDPYTADLFGGLLQIYLPIITR